MVTCLVVDDEENNRMIARFVLEDLGHVVLEAGSVEEALSTVVGGECDIVLLDWMMPEIDGLEFITLLRESAEGSKIKIVMCTAKEREEDKQEALKAGADGYINKPITPDSIQKAFSAFGF